MALPQWLKITSVTAAGLTGIWLFSICLLMFPTIQRNAVYVHNANPTFWEDLSNVEQFGFLERQVQPFTVTTPDNVTIFAWHILPVHLYEQHEKSLLEQKDFGVKPWEEASKTVGLQLLLEDPDAMLVVSFHGNAGHVGSARRPPKYRQLLGLSTPQKPVHVIAFDYRGFGLSTGSPTERGVIQDSLSLLSALTGIHAPMSVSLPEKQGTQQPIPDKTGIKPSQIILVGQSLGTFISAAIYHDWILLHRLPEFRGLILMASFESLSGVLDTYSFKGLTPPLLQPVKLFPTLHKALLAKIVDSWETGQRLQNLIQTPGIKLDITIMHAKDDLEIAWQHGRANWDRVMKAVNQSSEPGTLSSPRSDMEIWKSSDASKIVRWYLVPHGGHNSIMTGEPARLAVLRLLNEQDTP